MIYSGALADAITRDFGSLDALKTQLSASTVAVQGSGWGWLGFNKNKKCLQIATCANQVKYLFDLIFLDKISNYMNGTDLF